VLQVFTDIKKTSDSGRREDLCSMVIGFGIPRKLIRLMKLCLNETCSRVGVGKNPSDTFPIKNSLKQANA
jgi:hypothetical protein